MATWSKKTKIILIAVIIAISVGFAFAYKNLLEIQNTFLLTAHGSIEDALGDALGAEIG
jgi:VanZ family protein